MLTKLAKAVVGAGVPTAAAGAYVLQRYAQDTAYRQWIRADVDWAAPHIDEILKEHFPRAHQEIRIEEDAEEGREEDAGPKRTPRRGTVNPGSTPLPKQPLSEGAARFYSEQFCKPEQPE